MIMGWPSRIASQHRSHRDQPAPRSQTRTVVPGGLSNRRSGSACPYAGESLRVVVRTVRPEPVTLVPVNPLWTILPTREGSVHQAVSASLKDVLGMVLPTYVQAA